MTRLLVFTLVIAAPLAAQRSCGALLRLSLPDVTIVSSTPVAGPFALPGANRTIDAPAFCRVIGAVRPEVNFEVWLPVKWNRKFLGVGNGGQGGSVNYTAMAAPLSEGYATASTDTGHTIGDPAWALNHFQRIIDYGYRSTHVMTQAAKAITAAHYGRAPEHSYFEGCSNGGRQALMEAQRYPDDYDGIVAGDPAADWTHLYIGGHLWVMRVMEGDAYIPAEKLSVLAAAVNKRCDALDGVVDGILNDPRRCHFDPGTLACRTGNSDPSRCFTRAQIGAIRKLWRGLRLASGEQVQPGLMPGGEDGPGGWSQWIVGKKPGSGGHTSLAKSGFQYMIYENPSWDYRSFRYDPPKGFDSEIDFVDEKLAAIMNATNPDLRAFKARGGKLIQYHGWSDPDISPLTSILYYEKVAQFINRTANQDGGVKTIDDFYRLFLVPGMQHCTGGPGPNEFNRLNALEQWVEKGHAPERIIATHLTDTQPDRTRPLCPYPGLAVYDGTGSIDQAENFSCSLSSVQ